MLQRRCFSQMINYKYLAELPFYGSFNNDWAVDGMAAIRQISDEIVTGDYSVHVMNGKDATLARHLTIFDDITDLLHEVI